MLLEAARRDNVSLDGSGLGYALRQALERAMMGLLSQPEAGAVQKMNATVALVHMLPFEVNLWRVQNDCYRGLQQLRPSGDSGLVYSWEELARNLGINPDLVGSAEEAAPTHEPVAA
jgi:hypothetical protein